MLFFVHFNYFVEPLNDALLILWGFMKGTFGTWPTLRGIEKIGTPPSQLVLNCSLCN